ncbi:hypothetical protein FMEXI_5500 [Fusarium mexicanum]|uniref:Uncharacterized protein n=1 Tax=Fusarium mexicanum TaxID=751941 RepID=A0A8H5J0T8_9HYPO|nr:hypothetical protein FMEXI_5500 [Fusarium mexicanum]
MANKKFTLPFRLVRGVCEPVPWNQDNSHVWLAHFEAEQPMSKCTLTLERTATLVRDYNYAAAKDMKVTMETKSNRLLERGYDFDYYDGYVGSRFEEIFDDQGVAHSFITGVTHLAVMAARVHWFIHGLNQIGEGHPVEYDISILYSTSVGISFTTSIPAGYDDPARFNARHLRSLRTLEDLGTYITPYTYKRATTPSLQPDSIDDNSKVHGDIGGASV